MDIYNTDTKHQDFDLDLRFVEFKQKPGETMLNFHASK